MKKFKVEITVLDEDEDWPTDESELSKIVTRAIVKEDPGLMVEEISAEECFDEILPRGGETSNGD